jgi:predicted nucleic acid-binding protein
MIIIDSCVWISFLDENDSLHKKAMNLFISITWEQVFLPNLIYYEVITVLKIKKRRHQLLDNFEKFRSNFNLKYEIIEESVKQKALLNFFQTDKPLSFVDCILWTYSQAGNKIKTFDKELIKIINK